jgi:hypothetical protein
MSQPFLLKRFSLASLCLLTVGACSFTEPTLQDTRTLELDVATGSRFIIESGAGPMTVEGDDGNSIRVEADIYQRTSSDDYTLELALDGENEARLVVNTPMSSFGKSDYIDVRVRVPSSIQLEIDDGSGSLRVSNLDGDVDIDDDSGSLDIANIGGNLNVDDGSGSVTIERIGGDVSIDDGSGSINVSDVGGKVTVKDGSGSINVTDAGDFELIGDGSGSVNLDGIRKQDS